MGSISGDIITILKAMTNQCKEMDKHEVYIWEDSTPENFCYAVLTMTLIT